MRVCDAVLRERFRSFRFWGLWETVFAISLRQEADCFESHKSSHARVDATKQQIFEYSLSLKNFPNRHFHNPRIRHISQVKQ